MKVVVQVRLFPDAAGRATLDLCNDAANLTSAEAFGRRVYARQSLQRLTYGRLKDMGLSAQPAIHVARKVAGAYATLTANIRAGNLGPAGSKRRKAVEGKPIRFRRDAAQPYDDRCLSWQLTARTVSIWTTMGRLAGVRFACSDAQHAMLAAHRRGESDLVCHAGKERRAQQRTGGSRTVEAVATPPADSTSGTRSRTRRGRSSKGRPTAQ